MFPFVTFCILIDFYTFYFYTLFYRGEKMKIELQHSKNLINQLDNTKKTLNSIINIISKSYKNETYVIDRFEEDIAICENVKNKDIINLPIKNIPSLAKPGDVLKSINNILFIDKEETLKRKEYIESLANNLYKTK